MAGLSSQAARDRRGSLLAGAMRPWWKHASGRQPDCLRIASVAVGHVNDEQVDVSEFVRIVCESCEYHRVLFINDYTASVLLVLFVRGRW